MGLNLKNVSSGNSSAIPAGRYNLRIEKADFTQSSSGNDMIKLQMSVLDGKHKGRFCFDHLVLTENSLWKLKSVLAAVGSQLGDSEDVEPDELANDLLYKTLNALLEVGTTNTGTPTNNVKAYQIVQAVSGEDKKNFLI
jgi:hypothetical protein